LLLFHKCQTLLNSKRSQGWKQTSARPCSIAIDLKVVVVVFALSSTPRLSLQKSTKHNVQR